jgi:phage terminase large subunit-like protein
MAHPKMSDEEAKHIIEQHKHILPFGGKLKKEDADKIIVHFNELRELEGPQDADTEQRFENFLKLLKASTEE